ncbi:hypothetical protein ACFVRR_06710 [Gottfriedia sp. NPDC057948]|uniref:hypothetical protein n=1 Tax=Gottfriedia sp. NPDC057948 TaxID=3346287 RepID=UPI0036D9CC48
MVTRNLSTTPVLIRLTNTSLGKDGYFFEVLLMMATIKLISAIVAITLSSILLFQFPSDHTL